MKMSNVKFLWCSDQITRNAGKYWANVMDISKTFTISRLLKCCQAMGRTESTSLKTSQIMYPAMQATDIFFLKVDICQLGLDQRKCNMLARDYASAKKFKRSPISLASSKNHPEFVSNFCSHDPRTQKGPV